MASEDSEDEILRESGSETEEDSDPETFTMRPKNARPFQCHNFLLSEERNDEDPDEDDISIDIGMDVTGAYSGFGEYKSSDDEERDDAHESKYCDDPEAPMQPQTLNEDLNEDNVDHDWMNDMPELCEEDSDVEDEAPAPWRTPQSQLMRTPSTSSTSSRPQRKAAVAARDQFPAMANPPAIPVHLFTGKNRTPTQKKALSESLNRGKRTVLHAVDLSTKASPEIPTLTIAYQKVLEDVSPANIEAAIHPNLAVLSDTKKRMARGVSQVLTGQVHITKVHKISRNGIEKAIKRLKNTGHIHKRPGPKPILEESIENELLAWIKDYAKAEMARFREECFTKANQLAKEQFLRSADGSGPWQATDGWWRRLMERNPQLREKEMRCIAALRAHAANPVTVMAWLKKWRAFLYSALDGTPDAQKGQRLKDLMMDLYMCDETGIFMAYDEKQRVVTMCGLPGRRVGQEIREWVSVCAAGSCTGKVIPPFFIFSRQMDKTATALEREGPTGTKVIFSEKGMQTTEGFMQYVKWFAQRSGATPQRPVVLLTDGHTSRLNAETLLEARLLGVYLFLLPPHTTHFLCPLDTHVFHPMKILYWRKRQRIGARWMRWTQFVHIFGEAYVEAFNRKSTKKKDRKDKHWSNIAQGFVDNGLMPVDGKRLGLKKDLQAFRRRTLHKEKEDREKQEALEAKYGVAQAPQCRNESCHPVVLQDSQCQVTPSLKRRPKWNETYHYLAVVKSYGGDLGNFELLTDISLKWLTTEYAKGYANWMAICRAGRIALNKELAELRNQDKAKAREAKNVQQKELRERKEKEKQDKARDREATRELLQKEKDAKALEKALGKNRITARKSTRTEPNAQTHPPLLPFTPDALYCHPYLASPWLTPSLSWDPTLFQQPDAALRACLPPAWMTPSALSSSSSSSVAPTHSSLSSGPTLSQQPDAEAVQTQGQKEVVPTAEVEQADDAVVGHVRGCAGQTGKKRTRGDDVAWAAPAAAPVRRSSRVSTVPQTRGHDVARAAPVAPPVRRSSRVSTAPRRYHKEGSLGSAPNQHSSSLVLPHPAPCTSDSSTSLGVLCILTLHFRRFDSA
jgi:hypothetical protein